MTPHLYERRPFNLMHRNQHRTVKEDEETEDYTPNNRKAKTLEKTQNKIKHQKKTFSETEISDLPDKEFKIAVFQTWYIKKMLTEIRRTMHRQVRISTETKYKCKKELELKNLTTEKYKWGIQQGTK